MISRSHAAKIMEEVFEECQRLRGAGQEEYAHSDTNALANFERVGSALDISRERVLMIYLLKHLDGINAWIKGHKSQREDVRGRINDAIVYLCLLRAMVEDNQLEVVPSGNIHVPIPEPLAEDRRYQSLSGEFDNRDLRSRR